MSDSVKFIFKTLIKVPCYIFVAYLIFNLFLFATSYFKLLGFSYVVMQTAVENNYLPQNEYNQLNAYLQKISQGYFIDDAYIITNSTTSSSPSYNVNGRLEDGGSWVDSSVENATRKRQYGENVIVGVAFRFHIIWPLRPDQQSVNGQAVAGFEGTDQTYYDDLNTARTNANVEFNTNYMSIWYNVPGLKYYPDL